MARSERYQQLAEQAIEKARQMRARRGDLFTSDHLAHMTIQTLGRRTRLALGAVGLAVLVLGVAAIILLRSDCAGLTAVTLGLAGVYFAVVGVHRSIEEVAHHAKDQGPAFVKAIRSGVFD